MEYVAHIWREGNYWLAEFPDCAGCQTCADSREDIEYMAKEALDGWLETHLDGGEAPPAPKARRRVPRGRSLLRVEVDPAVAVAIQIRQARADLGISQGELAKRAGVSQQQIAKLERPGENPTIGTLAKIAWALDRLLEVGFRAPQ